MRIGGVGLHAQAATVVARVSPVQRPRPSKKTRRGNPGKI